MFLAPSFVATCTLIWVAYQFFHPILTHVYLINKLQAKSLCFVKPLEWARVKKKTLTSILALHRFFYFCTNVFSLHEK
jgi:hypothetical protein